MRTRTRLLGIAVIGLGGWLGYLAATGYCTRGTAIFAEALVEPPADVQDKAAKRPNVVFILVDNVGWGDFSVYGGTVPTPRIDSIAKAGVRLNNYSVEAQCTPSRGAILTGRLPVRSGTTRVPMPGEGASGLAPWEFTVAKLYKLFGYVAALFGKWHPSNG